MKTSFLFADVSMPLLVTYLNQASLLSSVMSCMDLRMDTKKDAFKIDATFGALEFEDSLALYL